MMSETFAVTPVNVFVTKPLDRFPQFRFLKKIMDELRYDYIGEDLPLFFAGGCFKSILLGHRIKDIDVFFETESAQQTAWSSLEKSEKVKYRNDKAWGMSLEVAGAPTSFDFVTSVYGTPEQVLAQFDFTVSKFALSYTPEREEGVKLFKETLPELAKKNAEYFITYHQDAFEHFTSKKLVLDDAIPFPESTFNRVLRYTKYGFNLCNESRVSLLQALRSSTTDLNDTPDLYAGGFD
jgi:hypothetical protein